MPERTIPVVYFSFAGDAALLEQSIRALRFIGERDPSLRIPVYVFDDGAHPLPEVPEGVHYEATSFPRNGNLMGIDCIRGMVACYNSVFLMEPDAQVLVKCDCDTVLNNLDIACSGRGLFIAGAFWSRGSGLTSVCGERYALSRQAADMASRVLSRDAFARSIAAHGIRGEDESLTAACRFVPGCRTVFLPREGNILSRCEFDSPLDERLRGYGAVVFKVQRIVGGDTASARTEAASMMREYNDATEARLRE